MLPMRDVVPCCLFVVLVLQSCCWTETTASPTTSRSLVALPSTDDKQARIAYVRNALRDRWDYVQQGKRMKDIREWVKQQGGEAKIFSMHGVDVNFEMDELQNLELDLNIVPLSREVRIRDDPFLPDRLNLNLANSTDSIFNKGNPRENDHTPATTMQLALRAARLSFQFAPVLTTAWLAIFSRHFRCGVWYKWVSSCLASSGAAFIKWGQWAATRTDMFPQELCDALADLHSDAPAHSWEFTQQQVESSLDIPPGTLLEVFKSFDQEPMASGSIAQVHKAELNNGELIAAKVRHPRVAQLMEMDFRLMGLAATVCDWVPAFKWLRVKDSVAQFSHTMAAQSHLNVEGHHLEVLNHNFRDWEHVRFPHPFYASCCLILETFEKGQIVTGVLDKFDDEATTFEKNVKGYELIPVNEAKFLVTTGVSLYLKMLLVDNLMHADLHPGNIMLEERDEKNLGKDPKYGITLVDAGMVAQLSEEESETFIGLLTCLGESDARAAAEFTLRFSIENSMEEEEKEAFVVGMEKLFSEKCRGYGTQVDTGDVLRGLLGLIRDHHVRIDANFATLVINILCVESLARRVCPSYNVLDAARPLLQTYRKVCYQSDGYTPVSKGNIHKKVKRLMPLMLYGRKKKSDDAFFRTIAARRRVKMASSRN